MVVTVVSAPSFKLNSQFIENNNGEVILNSFFFSPNQIAKKNIKAVQISYSKKLPFKSIKNDYYQTDYVSFDLNGRINRRYETSRANNGGIDTVAHWNYYQNNELINSKTTTYNGIIVKSYYYEEKKLTGISTGFSNNNSNSKLKLNISSYTQQNTDYVTHTVLPNGDSIVRYKSVNDVVFKKVLISWKDSATKEILTQFPYAPENNHRYILTYDRNILLKLTIFENGKLYMNYLFKYNTNSELLNYKKITPLNKTVSFTEFIYKEKSRNLQAIITKNYIENSIAIKKFNYQYFSN